MDERDKTKTALTMSFGPYEYKRMPFRVCNGSATFQVHMQVTTSDFIFSDPSGASKLLL